MLHDHLSYDQIDAVNISTLKVLWSHSPLHYQHRLETPREDTSAMLLGRAIHCAVLEPDAYPERYVVRPEGLDGRTKAGKAWLEDHSADEVLTQAQHATCQAVVAAIAAHPEAARFLRGGRPEVVLEWTDAETGVSCKGRADYLLGIDSDFDGALVGLKTARDVTPRVFARQAAQLGYHLQWAFYHDGLIALGSPPPIVVEVVVESGMPHDVVPCVIPDEVLEAGRECYRAALLRLVECRASGAWPGLAPAPVVLELPRWAMPGDEDNLGDLDFGGGA